MHPTDIWNGKGLGPTLARAALTPLSWLYAAGWQAYLGIYRLGIKQAQQPHTPVVVIGNLVVGGSGKSPTTLHLAKLLSEMGREVVIGCSGYGARRAEAASLAPAGPLDPAEWGDEPSMIRWLLPDVPLVVGRRRVLAAEIAHASNPTAVLLMDDGFQHLPLKKHVSLVIEQPAPQNENCLPAGPYREPRSNYSRADAVVWGASTAEAGFTLSRGKTRLVAPDLLPIEIGKATAICALGEPERFLSELDQILELQSPLVLPDHDDLREGTLLDRVPPGLPIVVTAKDWVKLRQRSDLEGSQFVIALQDVSVEPHDQFRAWLAAKLDEAQEQ